MEAKELLAQLSREQLEQMVVASARNIMAMDGFWFQAIERRKGMEAAMDYDLAAWTGYTVTEARRIKAVLGLPERAGLEGLAQALPLKASSLSSEWSCELDEAKGCLVFKITKCRTQVARKAKGMPYHPCKPVGLVEYAGFARTIDDRIACECLSCFPEVTDDSYSCGWRFTLE